MNDFPKDANYLYRWEYITDERIGNVILRQSVKDDLAANTSFEQAVIDDLRVISVDRMVNNYTGLLLIPQEAAKLQREWNLISSVQEAIEYLCTRKVTSGPYVKGSGCFLIKHVDEIRSVLDSNNLTNVSYSEVVKNIPFVLPEANTTIDSVFGIFDASSETLSCVNVWFSAIPNKIEPAEKITRLGWSTSDRQKDQNLKRYSGEFLNSDFKESPFGSQYSAVEYNTFTPTEKRYLNIKIQQDRYLTGDPNNPVYVDPPPSNTVTIKSIYHQYLVQLPNDYAEYGPGTNDVLYNAPILYDPSLIRQDVKNYSTGRQRLRYRPPIEFLQRTPWPGTNTIENNTFSAPFVVRDSESFTTIISSTQSARLWISLTPGGDQLSRWNIQIDPDIDDYVLDSYVEPDYVIDGNEVGYFGNKNIYNVVDFSTFNPKKWSRLPFLLEKNNVYWINIFADDNRFLDINANLAGRFETTVLNWPELDYNDIDNQFIIRL